MRRKSQYQLIALNLFLSLLNFLGWRFVPPSLIADEIRTGLFVATWVALGAAIFAAIFLNEK